MKIVAIIQARMGSTRLPGKILRELDGETVLSRVLGRVRRMCNLNEILVATTDQSRDDAVAESTRQNGVGVFRGNEDDVLDRYWQAAQWCGAEAVVRITSDCPLIDPELVDETIQAFLSQPADYASNTLERTYPRGLDAEVFTVAALEKMWRAARETYEREHVTPYLYEHQELFRLVSVRGQHDQSKHRWTLDTAEDLQLIRAIYAQFGNQDDFGWREVLALMEREPGLAELNSHVIQKAVHA